MSFLFLLLLLVDDGKAKPEKPLDWLTNLSQGYTQSLQRKLPVLVKVGGEGCVWCSKLDVEIAKPEVQKELAQWIRVSLDSTQHENDLKPFGIQGIPALRIVNGYGRIIATHDGYLTSEKLIEWLKKHHELAAQDISKELVEEEELTLPIVVKLVKTFSQKDSVFREAAIRRLLPNPEVAAVQVVDALGTGNLQARLAALELLSAWQAPIREIDPWQSQSLTTDRLKALDAWARSPQKKLEPVKELAADQLQSARLELQQLLTVDDTQVIAINERLARYGTTLLTEVYGMLQKSTADKERERLTMLRYRLVSRDALALRWADGLQRLAATQAATRHKAVQELAQQATSAEEPLLLELFSDPDALVREISLRTLHSISGTKATASLVKLLSDPEPNVRAAVLKQMAEKPSSALIPSIREYIAKEKDQDLVVHAVRVLRHAKGTEGAEALRSLLKHESWRVRAEAAESIGELHKDHRSQLSTEVKADDYNALIELLKDSDEFVISRAMNTLKSAGLPIVVSPLLDTAVAHPNLAPEILSSLADHRLLNSKSISIVKKFAADPNEAIRTAAVVALIKSQFEQSEQEVKTALKDSAPVRKAVCKTLYEQVFAKARGGNQYAVGSKEQSADDFAARLQKHDDLPKWLPELIPTITALLKERVPDEQLAAALLLLALGKEEPALETIRKLVKDKPAMLSESAAALTCLPWNRKLALFKEFVDVSTSPDQLEHVLQQFSSINDPRLLPEIWEFLGSPKFPSSLLRYYVHTMTPLYFGERYYDAQSITEKKRQSVVASVRPYLEKGPPARQAMALFMILQSLPNAALEAADKLIKDKSTSGLLLLDANAIHLMASPKATGREFAIKLLQHADPAYRRMGLEYLVMGPSALSSSPGYHISTGGMGIQSFHLDVPGGSGQAITVEPPKGVTEAMIAPLLNDKDPKVAALAAYLACTMGKRESLPILVKYWQKHHRTDDDWQRLAYRAIAVAGTDDDIIHVEEMYRVMRESGMEHYVSQLYWTIRGMEGPNALKLRKQIRQEIGMDRLR